MKYGAKGVYEVSIFDENGKLVSELDTLRESGLYHTEKGVFLKLKDALLDTKILEFMGEVEENNKTDYEKMLNKVDDNIRTILINKQVNKKCKIIAKSLLRSLKTGKDYEYILEIPNAEITDNYDFLCNNENPSEFDLYFELSNFDDKGNYCKLHIQTIENINENENKHEQLIEEIIAKIKKLKGSI